MKKGFKTLLASLIIATLSISASYAVSDIHCIGGGGVITKNHNYGFLWLNTHTYKQYYHDVDRVVTSVIYGEIGHDGSGCSSSDFYSYCAPGTVVGQG